MARQLIRTMAAFAGLALGAGAAIAQPAVVEDFGVLAPGTVSRTAPIASGQVFWYQFTLGAPVQMSSLGFLNVDTFGSTMTDSEVGLYNSIGNLVATDDDDAAGLLSALSFGSGNATFPGAAAVVSNGRDGDLAAGVYYLAVAGFNSTFNATGWSVVPGTNAGNYTINVATGTAPAVADPAGTVSFGSIAVPATLTSTVPLAASSVAWFKATIPAVSTAAGNFLDIDTELSALAPTN